MKASRFRFSHPNCFCSSRLLRPSLLPTPNVTSISRSTQTTPTTAMHLSPRFLALILIATGAIAAALPQCEFLPRFPHGLCETAPLSSIQQPAPDPWPPGLNLRAPIPPRMQMMRLSIPLQQQPSPGVRLGTPRRNRTLGGCGQRDVVLM